MNISLVTVAAASISGSGGIYKRNLEGERNRERT